jgi:hypothetical protein
LVGPAALPSEDRARTYQQRFGRCQVTLAEAALALGELEAVKLHLTRCVSSPDARSASVRARIARTSEALARLETIASVHTRSQPAGS